MQGEWALFLLYMKKGKLIYANQLTKDLKYICGRFLLAREGAISVRLVSSQAVALQLKFIGQALKI